MRRKVPQDAFDYYLSLGRERSYRAVAEWCGVAKQTITKVAGREQWQNKIAEIEAKARDSSVCPPPARRRWRQLRARESPRR